jgi:hypothetical protein
MRYNQPLQNSMKLPVEFRAGTLEFLNALMVGLAYNCIFNIMSDSGQVSDENLASLEKEISNNFYTVKDVLKNDSTLKKIFGYLLEDVLSKYYEFAINCLVRTANAMEKKHAEAKTKGYIGFQIAYLEEAVNVLKNMDKDSFDLKKALQKKFEPLKKKLEDTKLMNDQVFQAPIPKRDQLTDIKPIEQRVRPLEPKNIRILPTDAEFFTAFKSEEMEAVKQSLNLFVSNKKQHVEKTMFDLKERINDINKTYNVPFLKNLVNAGTPSAETQAKLAAIREHGENAIVSQVAKMAKGRQALDEGFHRIDKMVEAEGEKDKATLSLVQGGGFTTFVESNGEQMAKVNDLKQSYRGYRAMEEKIILDFERYRRLLPRLADPNVSLQELLTSGELSAFVQANLEKLQQLKKYGDGVELLVSSHLSADMGKIVDALKGIDIEKNAQKVLMNETNLEAIYKEINEMLGPLFLAFEEKVSKVLVPMDKVKAIAQEISASNQSVFQNNAVNDTLVAIDFFQVAAAQPGRRSARLRNRRLLRNPAGRAEPAEARPRRQRGGARGQPRGPGAAGQEQTEPLRRHQEQLPEHAHLGLPERDAPGGLRRPACAAERAPAAEPVRRAAEPVRRAPLGLHQRVRPAAAAAVRRLPGRR